VPGGHVDATGEGLDVEGLCVLAVHPVADAAQQLEVAEALRIGGTAGHLRDGATSQRSCPASGTIENVITGLAHSGVCVQDCDAAVAFYRDVLGMTVLSPPYVMDDDTIRDDMGELLPDPTMKAAIVGFGPDGDRVLEVIEYLADDGGDGSSRAGLANPGLSHVGLICEDIEATRADLESKGVRFLVEGIADVANVRTTWFVDPWGVVFILVEKSKPARPYFAQWG
jgi:catechol 2,3-dioxygenase-like lactoylglutathione lyase family enzyme